MPDWANCVTAVRYLYTNASNVILPRIWIGSLSGKLISLAQWKIHTVENKDCEIGDLLFLKRKCALERITHLAVALGEEKFLHCSYKARGVKVVQLDLLTKDYELVSEQVMIENRDSREKN